MKTREYHYLITVQWSAGPANNTATMHGVTPANGRTRAQLYQAIFDEVTRTNGAPSARAAVLFFALEPNSI